MSRPGLLGRWASLSLSVRILIGLGLGILTGLFLGELAQPLQVVSDAYIRLMQMTVVPYMAVALIVGLGQLSLEQARLLAVRGAVLLLLFWAIAFLVIFAMPLAFPDLRSASFFSTTLIEPKKTFDFVGLYIPSNPFHALANNIVPAVVFFCASVGIALIGIPEKKTFMGGMETLLDALSRVAKFVVHLTPYGVFAIGAVTAGTMTLEQFARLQVYFVTFVAAGLLLAFWILPGLVSAVTPFRYRDLMRVSRDALLTAFLTQSLFIVVPILVEHSKRLLEQYRLQTADTDKLVEVIIPVSFNFPNVGKLMTLLFVPFTAWMAGSSLGLVDYPHLFLIGLASYFAKAQTALPFLMDQFEIPQDLFQLYIPTSIVNGKFDTLVSAVNLLAFSLIGTSALAGYLVLNPVRILRYLAISALGLFLTVTAAAFLLASLVDTGFDKGEALMQMKLAGVQVQTRVLRGDSGGASGAGTEELPTVETIRQRGVLRVGYRPYRYPFSFFNDDHELVGFDIEIVNQLASDLGVGLELVAYDWKHASEQLELGSIDLAPNVPYLESLLPVVEYSDPLVKGTAAFVVRDHRRHDFESLEALQTQRMLTIGVTANPQLVEQQLRGWLPDVSLELVGLQSPDDFFLSAVPGVDALITTAEIGTALTLLHPEYAVVIPKPTLWRLPMGFATAKGAFELAEYLDGWVATHREKGTFQRAYDHWIMGEGAKKKEPRWSILRNVLHWVD
jgi:Na+/H+-dicarboxylate symporter/ABC-type amino acid transport substrate-binding protein